MQWAHHLQKFAKTLREHAKFNLKNEHGIDILNLGALLTVDAH